MNKRMKRLAALLLAAVMLMSVMTACGKTPDTEKEPPDGGVETPVATPETPETPDAPETPDIPEAEDKPAAPEDPETEEKPEEPKSPENSDTPAPSDKPETPETPTESETPAAPETPVVPDINVADYIAENYTLIHREKNPHTLVVNAHNTVFEQLIMLTGKEGRTGNDAVSGSFNASVGYSSDAAEVLIGNTNRKESIEAAKGLKALDYVIQVTGNKVVVLGGTNFSTAAAADKFVELLQSGEIKNLSTPYTYKYEYLKEHPLHPLCTDISSFKPIWSDTYKSPAWVGDFYETLYTATHSLKTGAGRPTAYAHRGDMTYYPEGSLEGMVSAYLGGADIVEIDIRVSKDFIPVSFHDSSLKDLTNWSEMAGKNGLPESDQVTDWTFAELKQLRLVKNGALTECRIPSFYEALAFAGGKVLLGIDDKTGVSPDLDDDYFPLGRDADGLEALFRKAGVNKAVEWIGMEGVSMRYIFNVQFFQSCMRANGAGIASAKAYYNTDLFTQEPFNSDYESQAETAENCWIKLIAQGYRTIGTNRIVAMCNYFDSVYTPSDYSKIMGG